MLTNPSPHVHALALKYYLFNYLRSLSSFAEYLIRYHRRRVTPDDSSKLQEHAEALDRIIQEALRVKAEVEARLREIRLAGRPASSPIERRQRTRKSR